MAFDLADGAYKFRVDYLGYQFWTDAHSVPDTLSDILTVPHQDVTITVESFYQGWPDPVESVRVYLFTESGSYMNKYGDTDDGGKVTRVAVKQLDYECYRDMALKEMSEIKDKAMTEFEINDVHMIHRIVELKPSEKIVMIAVSAAHRKEAFRACEFVIDELKKSVPIWKKEITVSGEHWVGSEKEV